MTSCEICKKQAKQKITNHEYCDNCFCTLIEKRVRKELRTKEQITHKDKIVILDNNSLQSKINIYFLKKIINDPTIKFETKKIKEFDASKHVSKKKTVIPWCLEDKAEHFLKQMTKSQALIFKNNLIIPLENITFSELTAFAYIKKIKTHGKKDKKSDINQFLEDVDKRYVGTKQALIKSINRLYGLK